MPSRMRLHAVGLATLALAACNKETPPPPTELCETDADCRVSCTVADRCCEACDCRHPYHKDELEAVRAANQKKCGAERCHRSCPKPTATWTARCREGRCVAEEVPPTNPPGAPAKTAPATQAPQAPQPGD